MRKLFIYSMITACCIIAMPQFSYILFAQGLQDSAESRYYFTGTVGDQNKIQMELIIDGQDVYGSYYYDKRGIPLTLSGSYIKESSEINMGEKGEKGLVTGTFKVKAESEGKDFAKSISGEWSSGDGNKKLPVKLTKVSDFISSKVTKGDRIEASILYPKFLSPDPGIQKINTKLSEGMKTEQEKFVKMAEGYLKEGDPTPSYQQARSYAIAYYSNSLISLIGEGYEFTGGAHGNTYYLSSNYLQSDGNAKLLTLSDLFTSGSDYIKVLSDYIVNDLLVKKAGWIVNGEIKSFKEDEISVFALSPEGIKFAFAPYAVGSYAEGAYFVTVPFHELSAIINTEGPLKQFVNPDNAE